MDILTQRRVTDLMSELDMLGIVNALVVSKGRYGRTKEIVLSVPVSSTQRVLFEDYRLKPLENFKPVITTQMHL
jgi:cell division control protein 6